MYTLIQVPILGLIQEFAMLLHKPLEHFLFHAAQTESQKSLIKGHIFLIELIEIFAAKYFSFENADLIKKTFSYKWVKVVED